MANEVYANGREIACKAASGKMTAAFPDTCLSPPPPPAGPMPVPYPNTASASDTTSGSQTVMISGQEVMLKDQSTFKTSKGDEAATKAQGMGVVTHTIQGEASFVSWSMDVMIEGQNVDRHLDQMIANEQSSPSNTATWPYIFKSSLASTEGPCKTQRDNEKTACDPVRAKVENSNIPERSQNKALREAMCSDRECNAARKCMLQPYSPSKEEGQSGCCEGKTPHHVIPAHCFMPPGTRGSGGSDRYEDCDIYDPDQAPCICVTGHDKSAGQHKKIHDRLDPMEDDHLPPKGNFSWSYKDAEDAGVQSTSQVTKCDPDCIRAQVRNYHLQKKSDMTVNTPLRADSSGQRVPDGFVPKL